jgi:hypothetical protein
MGCFGEGGVPIKITGLLFRGRCCTSFFFSKSSKFKGSGAFRGHCCS